jgi:hypothetical protein
MKLTTVRLAYGAILLVAPPGAIARVVRHPVDEDAHPVDEDARRVARVLGARQLLQGALEAFQVTPARKWAGAGIDALHRVSMVGAAVAWPRYRALAREDAAAAAALAVAGIARARTI